MAAMPSRRVVRTSMLAIAWICTGSGVLTYVGIQSAFVAGGSAMTPQVGIVTKHSPATTHLGNKVDAFYKDSKDTTRVESSSMLGSAVAVLSAIVLSLGAAAGANAMPLSFSARQQEQQPRVDFVQVSAAAFAAMGVGAASKAKDDEDYAPQLAFVGISQLPPSMGTMLGMKMPEVNMESAIEAVLGLDQNIMMCDDEPRPARRRAPGSEPRPAKRRTPPGKNHMNTAVKAAPKIIEETPAQKKTENTSRAMAADISSVPVMQSMETPGTIDPPIKIPDDTTRAEALQVQTSVAELIGAAANSHMNEVMAKTSSPEKAEHAASSSNSVASPSSLSGQSMPSNVKPQADLLGVLFAFTGGQADKVQDQQAMALDAENAENAEIAERASQLKLKQAAEEVKEKEAQALAFKVAEAEKACALSAAEAEKVSALAAEQVKEEKAKEEKAHTLACEVVEVEKACALVEKDAKAASFEAAVEEKARAIASEQARERKAQVLALEAAHAEKASALAAEQAEEKKAQALALEDADAKIALAVAADQAKEEKAQALAFEVAVAAKAGELVAEQIKAEKARAIAFEVAEAEKVRALAVEQATEEKARALACEYAEAEKSRELAAHRDKEEKARALAFEAAVEEKVRILATEQAKEEKAQALAYAQAQEAKAHELGLNIAREQTPEALAAEKARTEVAQALAVEEAQNVVKAAALAAENAAGMAVQKALKRKAAALAAEEALVKQVLAFEMQETTGATHEEDGLVLGGWYESQDDEGTWWKMQVVLQNPNGSYGAVLDNETRTTWDEVWAHYCRPVEKPQKKILKFGWPATPEDSAEAAAQMA